MLVVNATVIRVYCTYHQSGAWSNFWSLAVSPSLWGLIDRSAPRMGLGEDKCPLPEMEISLCQFMFGKTSGYGNPNDLSKPFS